MTVVIALGSVVAIDLGLLSVARVRAQTAADLAALASLTPSVRPPGEVAAALAQANGARLLDCTCQVDQAIVTVARDVSMLPAGPTVRLVARARAVVPVSPLLDSWSAGGPAPAASTDVRALLANPRLELTPNARADLAAGVVDRRLVVLLTLLLRDHRLAVSVFRTGHSRLVEGTHKVSLHSLGRAADISKVDGEPVAPGHPPSRAVTDWLNHLTGPLRPSEVGSPFPELESAPGHFSNRAHLDHLHIGVG